VRQRTQRHGRIRRHKRDVPLDDFLLIKKNTTSFELPIRKVKKETLTFDPGFLATDSLNSLTALSVLPSTSTPDVELSSLCVTLRVALGNPRPRSAHPPQCSTALDSCAIDGSLCGLSTTVINKTRRQSSNCPYEK